MCMHVSLITITEVVRLEGEADRVSTSYHSTTLLCDVRVKCVERAPTNKDAASSPTV